MQHEAVWDAIPGPRLLSSSRRLSFFSSVCHRNNNAVVASKPLPSQQQRCCCCIKNLVTVSITLQSIGCFSIILFCPKHSNHHHHRASSPQGPSCCCCIKTLVTIQSIACSVIFAPNSNSFWTTPRRSNHDHRAVTVVAASRISSPSKSDQ